MTTRKNESCAGEKPLPAWSVVAERQKCKADGYWLISQPDHANLSGELAANFVSQHFPQVSALAARAIAVHDAGWGIFPQESSLSSAPLLAGDGKPMAFVEFAPAEFLRAWAGSIGQAEAVCPDGGVIVSRHFCALGKFRLQNNGGLNQTDRQLVRDFLEREQARQERLLGRCSCSAQELNALLEVLQFCDLLSLYLCSGAQNAAEFPQNLTDRPVQIWPSAGDGVYRLDPSPFQREGDPRPLNLGVRARYYPPEAGTKQITLSFRLT
jgi:hypothetical protein